MSEAGLLVQGLGIIDSVANACLAQVRGEAIASFTVGHADGELVPGVVYRCLGQNDTGRIGEYSLIQGGVGGAG